MRRLPLGALCRAGAAAMLAVWLRSSPIGIATTAPPPDIPPRSFNWKGISLARIPRDLDVSFGMGEKGLAAGRSAGVFAVGVGAAVSKAVSSLARGTNLGILMADTRGRGAGARVTRGGRVNKIPDFLTFLTTGFFSTFFCTTGGLGGSGGLSRYSICMRICAGFIALPGRTTGFQINRMTWAPRARP